MDPLVVEGTTKLTLLAEAATIAADVPLTVTEEIPLFPNPESLAVPDTVIGLVVTV